MPRSTELPKFTGPQLNRSAAVLIHAHPQLFWPRDLPCKRHDQRVPNFPGVHSVNVKHYAVRVSGFTVGRPVTLYARCWRVPLGAFGIIITYAR